MEGAHRRLARQDGVSPAQVLVVALILGLVVLGVVWSLGRAGL